MWYDGLATIFEYFDDSCSDSEIKNETEAQIYECDNSGDDCDDDIFIMTITEYMTSHCTLH